MTEFSPPPVAGCCRAAVVQHPPVFLNLEASLGRALELIGEAAAGGAALIVFPETWLPGYPVWIDSAPGAAIWGQPAAHALYHTLAENAVTVPGPHMARLQEAARARGVHVVMGAHERRGGTLYNTILFIDPAGGCRVHRKLTPTYTERLLWGQGDGSTLAVGPGPIGPLGGLICWEHWLPLARAAMHALGETIHVAQWPSVRELHQLASRHYAFEGQCFVLAAGTVLTRGDVIEGYRSLGTTDPGALALLESIEGDAATVLQPGGSTVIAPDASYLAGPLVDEPGILYADLDAARIVRGHLLLDTDGHYSRPDVFRLHVDTRPRANVTFGGDDPSVS
ncbi:MAG TPA: carbon-nitrogen hydrolase family protein [Acidobacteriota bacterium]|mgnify:CR=1 FL=1|nr:carbon-nitrogen hydrolase family protein [Acidobacteriota bacterium]HQM63990.1 carbon-nitrogen hydrolase family protein [Acidobacteriota bacterium]